MVSLKRLKPTIGTGFCNSGELLTVPAQIIEIRIVDASVNTRDIPLVMLDAFNDAIKIVWIIAIGYIKH